MTRVHSLITQGQTETRGPVRKLALCVLHMWRQIKSDAQPIAGNPTQRERHPECICERYRISRTSSAGIPRTHTQTHTHTRVPLSNGSFGRRWMHMTHSVASLHWIIVWPLRFMPTNIGQAALSMRNANCALCDHNSEQIQFRRQFSGYPHSTLYLKNSSSIATRSFARNATQ